MKQGMQSPSGGCGILAALLVMTVPVFAQSSRDVWQRQSGRSAAAARGGDSDGDRGTLRPLKAQALGLDRGGMAALLAGAPREFTNAAKQRPLVIELPDPDGKFQRFTLVDSPVMEKGLAAKHPETRTYAGRGIDDTTARIRASFTPLGFSASVRSTHGAWYIDPERHLDQSVYLSYYRRDLKENVHGAFSDVVEEGEVALRRDVDEALAGAVTNAVPTGNVMRIYRLALITDPGYATFFGGPANVHAAKVALINRVTQLYEEDMSIRLVLVTNNDLLNLDTWDKATAPNGPCGAAACFTQAQVTGCSSTTRARYVIGQIIGASNYDIGHLALGQPGGGVANLGVIGRSNKAGGCTGIPTPVGDFYAVDYVAHEMGHQFSGNHTFNGNQLNCSGGNRNAGTSVEPGSGSSVMAYAGICLTDDLQPHSDPYFSQRSQQEITTYVTSTQSAINEVQTASLYHFGGGNEVQVATFGTGFAPASTIRPLSLNINAVPSGTSRGGAEEDDDPLGGDDVVTIAVSASHGLQVGDVVTVAGVANAGYNGMFTVTAVPSSRAFQYKNPIGDLPNSGGGTVTLATPGASESGNTVTIRTTAVHGRSVGQVVTISGVGVAGYNGTFTITAVPTDRSFEYANATAGLANSGAGTASAITPFQVRIGGNDSQVIGTEAFPYTTANLQTAINGISGFGGTVTVSGASATGFTVTYGGAAAALDVSNFQIVGLSCSGCFASVEETNHGGAVDSFTIHYNGADSAPIVNGTNYSAAGIKAAIEAISSWPAGATATIAGFGGGTFGNTGFQVTFGGAAPSLGLTNVPLLSLTNLSSGATGFFGETDKGGAVDNQGGPGTGPIVNEVPVASAPTQTTIPLRTPFYLTGSATDADAGDTLLYSWEQNDRGAAAGASLLNNVKTAGPLFAMFPKSAPISEADTLLYQSPNENLLTSNPTRVFPDLQQILDNNTNADTGACPVDADIAPPVAIPSRECFSEFLPTMDYVGFSTTGFSNASPLSLHFRFSVRDGHGGTSFADTLVLLDNQAGPFRVTSPDSALALQGGSFHVVTWDVANTNAGATNATSVAIRASVDGGHTYPYILAADTPNDGSEAVFVPNVTADQVRVMVDATSNGFFDVSNADSTITADVLPPSVTVTTPNGGETVYSGVPYLVSWTASDNAALEHFDVYVSYDGGSSYAPTPVCSGVSGSATSCSATFTVGATNTSVRVRVVAFDAVGLSAADASNANFTVSAGLPFVTVTAPDTVGISWQVGATKQVKFIHSLGKGAPVRIELNRNYPGGGWETIAASTPTTAKASSAYSWTITGAPTLGATARIRVTSVAQPSITDTGNASFTLTSRVKVTTPNTAVSWKVGTTRAIKFSHNYPTPHTFAVAIDRDGNGVCEEALTGSTSAATATATYSWLVSGPAGATNRICVTSTSDPLGTDVSDVNFTIQP
jgi:hypothetical protein